MGGLLEELSGTADVVGVVDDGAVLPPEPAVLEHETIASNATHAARARCMEKRRDGGMIHPLT